MGNQEQKYISISDAAERVGVKRQTLYYYMEQLAIKTEKFPLDKTKYLKQADFEKIRSAKQAAMERQTVRNQKKEI